MGLTMLWAWVGGAIGLVLVWFLVRAKERRRDRSSLDTPIDVDDERRRQLRTLVATDYAAYAARRRRNGSVR
jgi:hypothetical protein